MAILDDRYAAQQYYTYDIYGKAVVEGDEDFQNDCTFTGAIAEGGDIYYMHARFYDANTQRFLSQDTYKGNAWEPMSQNLYSYVGNNPVNYVDPTGHRGEKIRNYIGKRVRNAGRIAGHLTADFIDELINPKTLEVDEKVVEITSTYVTTTIGTMVDVPEALGKYHGDGGVLLDNLGGALDAVEIVSGLNEAMENGNAAKYALAANVINTGAQKYNQEHSTDSLRNGIILYPPMNGDGSHYMSEDFIQRSYDINNDINGLGYDWFNRSYYWDDYNDDQRAILINDVIASPRCNMEEFREIIMPFSQVAFDMFFVIYG